jgi:hypothetical protein
MVGSEFTLFDLNLYRKERLGYPSFWENLLQELAVNSWQA